MTEKRKNEKVSSGPERPPIDEKIEAELGNQLREAFCDVLNEPIPDRFRELIQSLAKGADR